MSELPAMAVDDQRLLPAHWVTSDRVGEEGILHDDRAGQVHVLNASAARVWDLCTQRPTVAELTAALAKSYDVPEDTVRSDVLSILDDFRAKGLLEPPLQAPR